MDYVPKIGDWFDALDRDSNHVWRGCPIKCSKAADHFVHGVDAAGHARLLPKAACRFRRAAAPAPKGTIPTEYRHANGPVVICRGIGDSLYGAFIQKLNGSLKRFVIIPMAEEAADVMKSLDNYRGSAIMKKSEFKNSRKKAQKSQKD